MKKNTFLLFSCLFALACSNDKAHKQEAQHYPVSETPPPPRPEESRPTPAREKAEPRDFAISDSVSVAQNKSAPQKDQISSSAAKETNKDSTRKFIRTADVKFLVKDVRKATFAIEDITAKFNGFVSNTQLVSEKNNTELVPISKDSSLETVHFTVINNMVLRVPNTKLDTTLKEIAQFMEYLDYRTITAQDVAIDLLANSLQAKRSQNHSNRITQAIDNRGRKLGETTDAEESVLNAQSSVDDAKIANLRLKDQIQYSTITLHIYQREAIFRTKIANDTNIRAYKPGFFQQIGESFVEGWEMLQNLLIGMVNLWFVWILVALGVLAWRKWKK